MSKISLQSDLPELLNEIADEIRLFIPVRKIDFTSEFIEDGWFLRHFFNEKEFCHTCELYYDGSLLAKSGAKTQKPPIEDEILYKKMRKRGAKQAAFSCLNEYFKKELPWGNLTGIRPTKLYRENLALYGENCDSFMKNEFHITEEKLALLRKIESVQKKYIKTRDEEIDIYIGIPYCTTRCAYCSFSSAVTTKNGEAEKRYVDCLLKEIDLLKDIISEYKIRCVYIGGGTPTALSDKEFTRVVRAAAELSFGAKEFTVEAGRPDTITENKLKIILDSGATRVSVNAQTTNDATLQLVGRNHTYAEFLAAYELVKKTNLKVNTDLIAGLPGENEGDVLKSVSDVIALSCDNITLHTLAIKNASRFAEQNMRGFMDENIAQETLSKASKLFDKAGYLPYYMYRQKYMAGNLENVGYSRYGCECIYNIDIMEETTSILAFGAGGMSKRVFSTQNRIERTPAVKDILNYVTRTEEMALRKRNLFTK